MKYELNGNTLDIEIEHKIKHEKVIHFYIKIKDYIFKNGSFYYLAKAMLNDVLVYINSKKNEYPGKFYSLPVNVVYETCPSDIVYDIIQQRFCS